MMMIMMMMFAWGLTALSAQPRSPHGALPLHGQYYITVPSVLQPVCSSLLFVRRVWGHFYRQKGRRNIRYDGNIIIPLTRATTFRSQKHSDSQTGKN